MKIRSYRDLPHLSEQEKRCLVCWKAHKCANYRKIQLCRFFKPQPPMTREQVPPTAMS